MAALTALLMLLAAQSPGDGWGLVDHRPREVKRLYHDLPKTTEVWVTLSPLTGNTVAGPRMAVQAFFPGREVRGRPQRIQMKVLPGLAGLDLSLRVVIDGRPIELSGSGGTSQLLYPPCSADSGCAANGIMADVTPELLRAMIGGAFVEVVAFGTTIPLLAADRAALGEFAKQIGLGR